MRRRVFIQSSSAAVALALTGCGGGGGGADIGAEDVGAVGGDRVAALASQPPATAAATQTNVPPASTDANLPSASTDTNLPSKILACYYTSWDTNTYKITDVQMDFNVIYLFHAKPNGTPVNGNWNNVGNGSFYFEHYSTVTAAQIQTCRNRGQKVILTVGGAKAGFNFDTRAKSTNFVASFQTMYNNLGGVDGCDFNNFEANIGSSPTELIWIASQLKSLYGKNFIITAPPQPNSLEDRMMLKAMSDAGVLTWASPQYYDWSGFNEPGFISNRTKEWVNDLGASKVMLGLSANYTNGPSLQDCIREWDIVKAANPSIRGMFCWSAQTQLAGNKIWGSTMKARL